VSEEIHDLKAKIDKSVKCSSTSQVRGNDKLCKRQGKFDEKFKEIR
jgi:hypothetical protein